MTDPVGTPVLAANLPALDLIDDTTQFLVVETSEGPYLSTGLVLKQYLLTNPLIRFTTDSSENVDPPTPFVDVRDLAALSTDRSTNLMATHAQASFTVTISRNGSSGGHLRNVYQSDGLTLIKAIPDGFFGKFVYDPGDSHTAASWYLAEYGSLS
jgi:hypothetical protein